MLDWIIKSLFLAFCVALNAQAYGTIYSMDTVDRVYNYTTDRYSSSAKGVAFQFKAPSAGFWQITARDTGSSTSKYVRVYTSSTFLISTARSSGYDEISLMIHALSPNETFWIKVYNRNNSDSSDNVVVKASSAPLVQVTADFHGSATPGDTALAMGNYLTIRAFADSGYRFSYWKRIRGSFLLTDSLDDTTTIRFSSTPDSSEVQAVFEQGTIKTIDHTRRYYNPDRDYFTQFPSKGVWFKYTATRNGACGVAVADTLGSTGYFRTLYYYGTDPFFQSVISQKSSSDSVQISFQCTQGQDYYFKVISSNFSRSFAIQEKSPYVLTLQTDDPTHCSIIPSQDMLIAGFFEPYGATADAGYRPSVWRVVSGNASLRDSLRDTVSVSIQSDAVVELECGKSKIWDLTLYDSLRNNATDYWEQNSGVGVAFRLAVPDSHFYFLRVDPYTNTYARIYEYDNDSLMQTRTYLGSSFSSTINYSQVPALGDTLYYRVVPNSSYYYRSQFYARMVKGSVIQMTSDAGGVGYLHSSSGVFEDTVPVNQAMSLYAVPQAGYRFTGFEVDSNQVSSVPSGYDLTQTIYPVADTVRIQAHFAAGMVYEISEVETTFVFERDYYEISPDSGIRVWYNAPDTGMYGLQIRNGGTAYTTRYVDDYGADLTYGSIVRAYGRSSNTSTDSFHVTTPGAYAWIIRPYSSSYYDDSIRVRVAKLISVVAGLDSSLAMISLGGTSAQDTVKSWVIPGDTLALTAVVKNGVRFNHWVLDSGNCVIFNDTVTTFMIAYDNCLLHAELYAGSIYELGPVKSWFNLETDRYTESDYLSGVYTWFNAQVGTYFLKYSDPSGRLYFYRYGSDSTFSSYTSYTSCSLGSVCRDSLTVSSPQHFYWTFIPYNSSYWYDSLWAQVVPGDTVSLTGMNGTISLASSAYSSTNTRIFPEGDTVFIAALPDSISRFFYWTHLSGQCPILDSTQRITQMIVTETCNVQAVMGPGAVYDVTDSAIAYNASEHHHMYPPQTGVRFRFVAPAAGDYDVIVSAKKTVYISTYNGDSSFTSGTNVSGSGVQVSSITGAAAGQSYYFLVYPSSIADTAMSFYINWSQIKNISITLTTNGNGTVIPSAGYPNTYSNTAHTLNATASSGYRFRYWSVLSGQGLFEDSLSGLTYVTPFTDMSIEAVFLEPMVYPLADTFQTFIPKYQSYEDNFNSGVRNVYQALDTGWYYLDFRSPQKVTHYVRYYGDDSAYSALYSSYTSADSLKTLFHIDSSLAPHFWEIYIMSTMSDSTPYQAKVLPAPMLTVQSSSKGRVYPKGSFPLLPGMDTVAYAYPWGGFRFDGWRVLSGSAWMSDSTDSKTQIRMLGSTGSCVIEAMYELDSSAQPNVKISDVELSNHPDICVGVTVTDSSSGRSMVGLDSSNFQLEQDGTTLPFQLTTVQQAGGVSVAIVFDESGSMGTAKLAEAKQATLDFVNAMGPLDRTAIVGFRGGSKTIIHQTMTSDKSALISAVAGLQATGTTNILRGTLTGLSLLVGETNPTSVIVFSDGGNGTESISIQDVVDSARALNTTIYSIGLVDRTLHPLKDIADGTGGYYTYTQTAAGLGSVYMQIKRDVQERYVLCYRSPDVIFNGDTHTVVVKTSFIYNNDADTAIWTEANHPPVIVLDSATTALVGVSQPQNTSLTLQFHATDDGSVARVSVYYRVSDTTENSYQELAATFVSGDLWEVVLPASMVVYPGFDFYGVAIDDQGLVGKTPNVLAPGKEPYSIPVGNQVPVIAHSSRCLDTLVATGSVTADITDADGTFYAVLFYRRSTELFYTPDTMVNPTGDNRTWVGTIPISYVMGGGIAGYYIRAVDNTGAAARSPSKDRFQIMACGPADQLLPPVATRLNPQAFSDSVFQDSAVVTFRSFSDTVPKYDPVRLYYTLDGSSPSLASSSILSGDTLVFKTNTVIRMFALGDSSQASVVKRFAYHPVRKLATPVLQRLDWQQFPDSLFIDSLHAILRSWSDTAADSPKVQIHYDMDGELVVDQSKMTSGDSLTISSAVSLIAYATSPDWLSSDTLKLAMHPSPQVSIPTATKLDNLQYADTLFKDSMCVQLDVAQGSMVCYSLDGSAPDTSSASGQCIATGDTLCFSQTVDLRLQGTKLYWKPSKISSYRYKRMERLPTPVANPSSRTFRTFLQVALSDADSLAVIHYTTDGTDPDSTSPIYSAPIRVIHDMQIKARAYAPAALPSYVMTQTYVKTIVPSQLILSGPQGTHWSDYPGVDITALTVYAEVDTARVFLHSKRGNDSAEIVITSHAIDSYWNRFHDTLSTWGVQIEPWDTLYGRWTNPADSTDSAYDTLVLRPKPQQAVLTWADSIANDTAWLTLKDQAAQVGQLYPVSVRVARRLLLLDGDSLQQLMTNQSLNQWHTPIRIEHTTQVVQGDSVLQVWTGDTLVARYYDPIDGDSAEARLVIGKPVELAGQVEFLDSAGNVWQGKVWNPLNTLVRVRLTDDRVGGLIPLCTLALSIYSTDSLQGVWLDEEQVVLTLQPDSGEIGVWEGQFRYKEQVFFKSGDGWAGVRFLSFVNGRVLGIAPSGMREDSLRAEMVVARADEPEKLDLTPGPGFTEVNRLTLLYDLRVEDQDYSLALDSLGVLVKCLQSGDQEQHVVVYEDQDSSGIYHTPVPLDKNEGVFEVNDGVLTCAITDTIVAVYHDIVYGGTVSDSVWFTDSASNQMRFLSVEDSLPIDSAGPLLTGRFLVEWEAVSPTIDQKDTLWMVITEGAGDKLRIPVVETDVYSGVFLANWPFAFQGHSFDLRDTLLTHQIQAADSVGRAVVSLPNYDSLVIRAAFVPIQRAVMADLDLDGQADAVRIEYASHADSLPRGIDTLYWNSAISNNRRKISGDSIAWDQGNWLIAYLTKAMPYGLTAPETPVPYLTFPMDEITVGRRLNLEDGVGAVPVHAVKYPGRRNEESTIIQTEENPDTLVITLSEPLEAVENAKQPWNSLFAVTASCEDTANSVIIVPDEKPEVSKDGLIYTVLISQNTPFVRNCLRLNPQAHYYDEAGNTPGRGGVEIAGEEGEVMVYGAEPYPRVVGLNKTEELYWIPPTGWENGRFYVPSSVNQLSEGVDNSSLQIMPDSIATIRVSASSPFIAEIYIFDHMGQFVKRSVQSFGYAGELQNQSRFSGDDKGRVSFLVWNLRDYRGRSVGVGPYIWKVIFRFAGQEASREIIVKTGVYHKSNEQNKSY